MPAEDRGHQAQLCHVCGQVIMMEGGSFGLPIVDPSTRQAITGICCGVCGPKVQTFCDEDCNDINVLPDGPLKARLADVQVHYMGQRCLEVVLWLAEHHGKVDFHNTDLVAHAPANEVTVTVTLPGESEPVTETAPTLEQACVALRARGKS